MSPYIRRDDRIQSNRSSKEKVFNEIIYSCRRSKWKIVQQRLPDILAMNENYKPMNLRGQLVLLMTMMNRQSSNNEDSIDHLTKSNNFIDLAALWPTNVSIQYGDRTQSVSLKRIPSKQWILVDIDGLSFGIPTRQFLFAISNDSSHNAVAKYCPPAISEMLIELSKIKIIDERKQFRRAQLKMRFVQSIFFLTFICIVLMVFVLIISVMDALNKMELKFIYEMKNNTSNSSFY